MNTDKHLKFIKDRIEDSAQAMMYRCLDESHKQVLGIKKNMVMDDNGQLYFPLDGNFEQKHTDDTFPVELFFYKKGNPFFITAKGIAVKSTKEKKEFGNTDCLHDNMVCVKMDQIEYSELEGFKTVSRWAKWWGYIGNLNVAF
ncbi:hypothetical protein [Parasediminibacterium sp. JCM 36343]|uniref:hypothetical protein n=1 Tax=Parasediminibacterium sp. JCM 36343 TaxID=3374279 RepID=UPI00397E11C6